MSKIASSSSPGVRLPNELLWEVAKCMGFEGLRQCCQTNIQLKTLTHSMAIKIKQKLEDYYLGDISLLAEWFECWVTKNRKILTELLLQCYRIKEAKKSARTQKIHGGQLFITMVSLMEEFCQSLDQVSDKMVKVIKAKLKSSAGHFHLSRGCQLHFSKQRPTAVERTFLAPNAQLYGNMRHCGKVFRSNHFNLTAEFSQELATCAQGIYRCEWRTHDCQKLMTRCADALLFPRCI